MHKGIVILTKAESKEEALERVEQFIDPYYCQVYDWYEVGGRWAGFLNNEQDKENNIMPLADCLKIVKEYKADPQQLFNQEIKRAEEYYGKNSENPSTQLYAHVMKSAYEILGEEFCFDCDVYNIDTYDFSIPEDPAGFWAVIVDFHN